MQAMNALINMSKTGSWRRGVEGAGDKARWREPKSSATAPALCGPEVRLGFRRPGGRPSQVEKQSWPELGQRRAIALFRVAFRSHGRDPPPPIGNSARFWPMPQGIAGAGGFGKARAALLARAVLMSHGDPRPSVVMVDGGFAVFSSTSYMPRGGRRRQRPAVRRLLFRLMGARRDTASLEGAGPWTWKGPRLSRCGVDD
jgi:hypothetical protein